MHLDGYPDIEFPTKTLGRSAFLWKHDEAREFFEWFCEQKPRRLKLLIDWADCDYGEISPKTWIRVAQKARALAGTQTTPNFHGELLTLSYDIGILLGQTLLSVVPGSSWQIGQSVATRVVHSNLPVVSTNEVRRDFERWQFEPFGRGQLTMNLLRRGEDPEEILSGWAERLTNEWIPVPGAGRP